MLSYEKVHGLPQTMDMMAPVFESQASLHGKELGSHHYAWYDPGSSASATVLSLIAIEQRSAPVYYQR